MTSVILLRTGWEPLADSDGFYPHDLPADWRLSYFANAFPAVLVPSRQWSRATPDVLRQWCLDVPDAFRFYVDGGAAPIEPRHCSRLTEALGVRLAGIVTGADDQALAVACPHDAGLRRAARAVPPALHQDLRQARRWLEDAASVAAGCPLLLLMGQVPFDVLARWQTLVRLLGLLDGA